MVQSKLGWWSAETSSTKLQEGFTSGDEHVESDMSDRDGSPNDNPVRTSSVSRCGRCWLRWYNCFCTEYLNSRQAYYRDRWNEIQNQYQVEIEIIMFYHAAELGRSANTAHVFEHICESITKVIIYGDQEKEEELVKRIVDGSEGKLSRPEHTCLLYPCNESISLNQWIDNHFHYDSNESDFSSSIRSPSEQRPLVRMIILDGTYPRAKHMMKFFKACKREFDLERNHSLDFVQLDLDLDKGIKSAVAGVMFQPAKDKICSYQATVMAIRQLLHLIEVRYKMSNKLRNQMIENIASPIIFSGPQLCRELDDDLDKWIVYILQQKIKYGKPTPRKSLADVDNQLPDHLKDVLVSCTIL